MKMSLLEFIKKFTTFKPPPYHEAFFEAVEKVIKEDKNTPLVDIGNCSRWYKDLRLNELLYSNLIKLNEGQTFAVASLEGIHIFKKTKFQSYQNESNITSTNTIKGERTNG